MSQIKRVFRCEKIHCLCSVRINSGANTVCTYVTKELFKINIFLNCSSDHVTFVTECGCGIQYVRRTAITVQARIINHRF